MSELRIAGHEPAPQNALGPTAWCRGFILGSSCDVRRWQCTGLLGMMALLQIAAAALTSQEAPARGTIWHYMYMARIGALLATPTLLALWLVFGPQPISVRFPLTLWLAAANYLAVCYGDWRANGPDLPKFLSFAGLLVAYLVAQLPLWLLRAVRGWRLEIAQVVEGVVASPPSLDRARAKAAGQFSTRSLLGWTLAIALLLAVVQRLVSDASLDVDDLREVLPFAGLRGLEFALAGWPVVALAWIVLVAERRPVWRSLLIVLLLTLLPGDVLLLSYLREMSRSEAAQMEAGTIANGLICLTVIAACGYRLKRRPSAACEAPNDRGVGATFGLSRHLALGTMPLLAMAVAVAWAAPQQLELWHRRDAIAEWRRGGFQVWFNDDGSLNGVSHIFGEPVSDYALQRIAQLDGHEVLEVTGSRIGNTQLAILAPMARLRDLSLSDCDVTDETLSHLPPLGALATFNLMNNPITDAGLTHLIKLPNLQTLHLTATEVTDDGLFILARLPRLNRLGVSLTAVTESGAKRFLAARPDVELEFGACDEYLGRWLIIRGHHSDLFKGMLPCRRNPLVPVKRLHLRGTKTKSGTVFNVTDAALAALADVQELEELDLRDTSITDAGLPFLANLPVLKRLDLRGTAVSGRAIAQLSSLLRKCEILRPATPQGEPCPE